MADLSPVLEAYFGGQKQQADLIGQARELSDSALRRQQAQEELKQRQQTIDEIAKQHGIENERQRGQDELAHQIFLDTKAYHTNEATDKLIKTLQSSGVSPDQFHDHLATLGIPGFARPSDVTDSSVNGLPDRAPQQPVNLPNVNVPEVNPVQTVNVPGYGPQQVPAWKTDLQQEVDKAKALAPIHEQTYKNTIGATDTEKLNQQMLRLQDTLSSREYMNKINDDLKDKLTNLRIGQADNAANHKLTQFMLSAGLPLDPEDGKKLVAGYAMDEMTGKGTGNPRTAYGPVMGNMVTQAIQNSGGSVMPAKVRGSMMGMANDTSQTLAKLQELKDSVSAPTTYTGKVSNVLADKFGVSGLSPYKSIYDAITTELVPKMDVALGFTPGTLSRSPKLFEKIKSIVPLPGDSAAIVQQKTADAADIFLSGINRQLSGYSPVQRKAIWQDIANDHSELIKGNAAVREKLRTAGDTGVYTPGTLYKSLGGQ